MSVQLWYCFLDYMNTDLETMFYRQRRVPLPFEILSMIFGHLAYDTRSLARACLVCQRWSMPATSHLFNCLQFNLAQVSKFSQRLDKSHLIPYIKSLLICAPLHAFQRDYTELELFLLVERLILVTEIRVYRGVYEPLISTAISASGIGQHIQTLALLSTRFNDVSELDLAVSSFPSLVYLKLDSVDISDVTIPLARIYDLPPPPPYILPEGATLLPLTRLSISACDPFPALVRWALARLDLQALCRLDLRSFLNRDMNALNRLIAALTKTSRLHTLQLAPELELVNWNWLVGEPPADAMQDGVQMSSAVIKLALRRVDSFNMTDDVSAILLMASIILTEPVNC